MGIKKMHTLYKDLVEENTHPMNVKAVSAHEHLVYSVERPPLYEIYMRMAEELSKRSTCSRLQVGSVITSFNLEQVLAVGYNGNARGFPNECDRDEPGNCGCIHSEWNALIKAPGQERKIAFITDSPCDTCGKLLVQANVSFVYYRRKYRKPLGLTILEDAGIPAIHYTRWKDEWR